MRATLTALCAQCIGLFTQVVQLTDDVPTEKLREQLLECPRCGTPAMPHHIDLTEPPSR